MRNKFEDWTAYYYWHEERQTPMIIAEVNRKAMGQAHHQRDNQLPV